MKRLKYTDIKKIKKLAGDTVLNIIIMFGKRSTGKSYSVKKEIIEDFMKDGKTFVYLRRTRGEVDRGKAGNYWRKMNESGVIRKWTNGAYDGVCAYGDAYYMYRYENGKRIRCETIGDIVYLASANRLTKSVEYSLFCNKIVFEEFITRDLYLDNEPYELFQFISTVFRGRNDCYVYLMGNDVTEYFPYKWAWNLNRMEKQEQGSLDIYQFTQRDELGEEYTVNIGVYRCADSEGEQSHMVFGRDANTVNSVGSAVSYTTVPKGYKFKTLYRIRIIDTGMEFMIDLIKDGGGYGVFIYPTSVYNKLPLETVPRVIYINPPNYIDTNPMHTTSFLDNKAENLIKKIFKDKSKVSYADNRVGDRFNMMLKNSGLMFR